MEHRLDPTASAPVVTGPPTASVGASAAAPDSASRPGTQSWAAPPPPPRDGGSARRGGRARFGTGLLVGAVITGAALGGYVVGEDGDTPAASAPAVEAEPVAASTGGISDLVTAARPSIVLVEQPLAGGAGGSTGTGFVLSADGYIVTNDHVVAGGDTATVTFSDGTIEQAQIVAADASRDLAVLQVDRNDLEALAVGDSDELRIGDPLVAVGYALGLNGEPSVTAGILSARDRSLVEPNGERLVNMLQTDTAINPGNSGGPLLNLDGQVIGINTAVAGQAQNIGFAIAITPVVEVIEQLRQGTVPERALLGVTTEPADGPGARIIDIAPGSGAAASSLSAGDVITAVTSDGERTAISDPDSLGSVIARHQPGDEVTVTVERDGRTVDVDVTLGATAT